MPHITTSDSGKFNSLPWMIPQKYFCLGMEVGFLPRDLETVPGDRPCVCVSH